MLHEQLISIVLRSFLDYVMAGNRFSSLYASSVRLFVCLVASACCSAGKNRRIVYDRDFIDRMSERE